MGIIDTHCHLDYDEFADERPAVLARARAAGVEAMVCIGAGRDLRSARGAVALAAVEPDVWCSVGIHPHDTAAISEADWSELDRLADAPRVVAIGETGLDYFYHHAPRDTQAEAYRRFIALARRVRRPIVSHIRDAHADAAALLRAEHAAEVGGVIHCFTGDVDDARAYLDMGFYLSFSGILTFKKADDVRRAAAFAPLDRLLVETDAPLLAPVPHRGKRNEPAFIVKTVEVLGAIKGLSLAEVSAVTSTNAHRLFAFADNAHHARKD